MIYGTTKLVGVMGWPIRHSRSPQMQNAALQAAGIDAVYVPLPVEPDRVVDAVLALKTFGFVGSNVTIPHKESVVAYMDNLTREAGIIGAVNTIRIETDGTMTGHNTDCLGAVRAAENAGAQVAGARVAIVGAGGAGRGVAAGCALAGAARISVLNRTIEKAERVVEEFSPQFTSVREWCAANLLQTESFWQEVDIVFQTTSVGMGDSSEIPVDPTLFPKTCFVLESVYAPLETPFLRAVRSKGLRHCDGLAMLLEQGAASFEFWFGREPDRAIMRSALEGPHPTR